jgi:hypothetical protein
MRQLGLHDVDVRMNDKVWYVNPDMQNYEQAVQDFMDIHNLDKSFNISNSENTIEFFMNRGVDRVQAEAYIRMKAHLADYFKKQGIKSFLQVQGLLITYGRK